MSRCCWNCARPWHASELVSFLVWLRTYQHPVIIVFSRQQWLRECASMSCYTCSACLGDVPFTFFNTTAKQLFETNLRASLQFRKKAEVISPGSLYWRITLNKVLVKKLALFDQIKNWYCFDGNRNFNTVHKHTTLVRISCWTNSVDTLVISFLKLTFVFILHLHLGLANWLFVSWLSSKLRKNNKIPVDHNVYSQSDV